MKNRFFLNYNSERRNKIDEWARYAVSLHIYTNHCNGMDDDEIPDNLEVEYTIAASMREWAIIQTKKDYKKSSDWALFSKSHSLALDSTLKDHHIIEIEASNHFTECIKASFDKPAPGQETTNLHSISEFQFLDKILEIESQIAASQIRWLELPNGHGGGIFLSTKRSAQVFVPLTINNRDNSLFKLEYEYPSDSLFHILQNLISPGANSE